MNSRSPLLTALLHPLHLAMLGLIVLAGLISAWWMLFVGALFWLVMVVTLARDPALRISHEMQRREPLAQRFQRYFDRIERAQVSVFNSLASAPPRTRRALQPVQAAVNALTDRVYRLCQRMTVLENYRLVSQSKSDLESDLYQLEGRLAQADDALIRQEYEETRQSLQERISKLQAVGTQLDRVEAQLVSLVNLLDASVTQVIRLQAMGAEAAAPHALTLARQLREEAAQLEQFEREAMRV